MSNIRQLNQIEDRLFSAYTIVSQSYHPGYTDITKDDWREALNRLNAVREAVRRMKERELKKEKIDNEENKP